MIEVILVLAVLVAAWFALLSWYRFEVVSVVDATVRLQSEHEHFHLHVDLPDHITIQPGDTVHILEMPDLSDGRTDDGEISFPTSVRFHKASWLARVLTKNSSLIEVNELVDHP